MDEENDEYIRKQARCYDMRGRRQDARQKHGIKNLGSADVFMTFADRMALIELEESAYVRRAKDPIIAEIDDLIDRGIRYDERPIPKRLRAEIEAEARALMAKGRWTDLRCAEMAISRVYLRHKLRPIRTKTEGLPCKRRSPTMAVCCQETEI
jgi:hypothetical protein